jgi:hypothetical protein
MSSRVLVLVTTTSAGTPLEPTVTVAGNAVVTLRPGSALAAAGANASADNASSPTANLR